MNYITEANYPAFKKAYEQATRDKQDTFMFEGQEILTAYAKYVVMYVEGRTQ